MDVTGPDLTEGKVHGPGTCSNKKVENERRYGTEGTGPKGPGPKVRTVWYGR